MSHRIVLRASALSDLRDAISWYERCRPGLGFRFHAAVQRVFDVIAGAPGLFPLIHRDVRRALVRPFPYRVLYRIQPDAVYIVGVLHCRRDPDRFTARLEEE